MFKSTRFKSTAKSTILKLTGIVALPLLLVTAAQASSEMRLALGFASTQAGGETVGSYSLSNIASRDSSGEFCLGYGDRTPDHVLTLEQDFTQLTIAVDSGGEDTTLLIQGPDNTTVRCNDNASRRDRDPEIQDTFAKGTYRVWVGAFEQEGRHRYNLTITE
ncbi:hypothetical protein N836_27095 [Leptolyngbya sp. Heron Island J]|uniref:hypothetical protein n=1 Tax=Leptolyngbya sp. Heron Island J TaxID=1385935 RepID=UPI0003B97ECA|nr:hypothetical protein [Leptolyngbya sp. Heron Island J]ESA32258.1 hypothetical protein N836_27095 [Leptolyngbya sp. Heron Island J]